VTWIVTLCRNASEKDFPTVGDEVPSPVTETRIGAMLSSSGNQPIGVPGLAAKAARMLA